MTSRIDRRSFLALGVGAVAWACSRDNGEQTTDPQQAVSLVVTAPQLVVGDTRLAFGIFRGGRAPIAPEEVSVRLGPQGAEPFDVEATKAQIAFGTGGDSPGTEISHIYVVRHDFDRPGVWTVHASFEDGEGEAIFQVLEGSSEPGPGDEAPAVVSPTTSDPGGVDPVCTRNPPCSMHEVTVAEAVSNGRPSVITFGTPAFCTSRVCGPVVDLVEQAKDEIGDEVNFVHVEVWRNNTDAVNNPPDGYVPAFAEWSFQSEPWTYFVDAGGIVVERFMGPAGPDEITRAARALQA